MMEPNRRYLNRRHIDCTIVSITKQERHTVRLACVTEGTSELSAKRSAVCMIDQRVVRRCHRVINTHQQLCTNALRRSFVDRQPLVVSYRERCDVPKTVQRTEAIRVQPIRVMIAL